MAYSPMLGAPLPYPNPRRLLLQSAQPAAAQQGAPPFSDNSQTGGPQRLGLLSGLQAGVASGQRPVLGWLGQNSAPLLMASMGLLLGSNPSEQAQLAMAGLTNGVSVKMAKQKQAREDADRQRQTTALQKALTEAGLDPGLADIPSVAGPLLANAMRPADQATPYTDMGKLRADLNAGLITPEQYQQAVSGQQGGMFSGSSVEAQALNYLVQNRQLTEQQAADVAAGKQVTGPNGELIFITPRGIVSQPPGGQPNVIAGAPQQGADNGQYQLTGPQVPAATRQSAQKAESAYNILTREIDNYERLIEKYGANILPGTLERDLVTQSRRNIQLQLKELYDLGVLNGPDLDLMNQMIIDPSVSLDNPLGWLNLQERAKASLAQLRGSLKTIRDERLRIVGRNPPEETAVTPEGTVIEMPDGTRQVKRNGRWEPL